MHEGPAQWSHDSGPSFSASDMPFHFQSQMNSSSQLGTTNVPSQKVYLNSQPVASNDAGPSQGRESATKLAQKPKRKKHRPKVVKEKKPANKPATPKPPPKEKGNKSTGKRKYVRRKGLNTTTSTEQPPSLDAHVQDGAGKKTARRSLNFDGKDQQENAARTQVIEMPTGPGYPRPSIFTVDTPVPYHWHGTSSSVSAPVNEMTSLQQQRPEDSLSSGVTFDLNYSVNQMPSECANLMDSSGQFIQSGPREIVQMNQLLDFHAPQPDNSVSHLNTSASQTHNISSDFCQHVGASQSSTDRAPRPDQMLRGYAIPKISVAHYQHPERVSIRGNSNPESLTRESVINNQLLQSYRVQECPIVPPMHSKRDAMYGNLNEFAAKNGYLSFATDRNNHVGDSFGHYGSCEISQFTTGKKREHNAISGPQISFDMNFEHPNNGRMLYDDPRYNSSGASYFTETRKKIRPENSRSLLDGDVGKASSSSAYLPSNWYASEVSEVNTGYCTLADVQKLIAREKSLAYKQLFGFGMLQPNKVETPNLVQQNSKPILHNTSAKDFFISPEKQFRYFSSHQTELPYSTMNSLREDNMPNDIQRTGNHQILEIRPTQQYSTDRDCVALPNKQSTYIIAEHTQLPSGTDKTLMENYTPKDGIHDQYLENRMVKGPNLIPETHAASTHDDTEQIRNSSAETVGQSLGESRRTEHCNLEASRETKAANTTKKPKARGRPRKDAETNGKTKVRCRPNKHAEIDGKPKVRGRPKKDAGINGKAKAKCTSDPSAGITQNARTFESERNGEKASIILENSDGVGSVSIHAGSISEVIARSVDPLDVIIQNLSVLYISEPGEVVEAAPENTLASNKSESGPLVPFEENVRKQDEVVAAAPLVSNKNEYGALVPFEGNAKRKRLRAKVNIDPVTKLMWNLIMAPDMSENAEGMDNDKEKWLDGERKALRGKIDSFIARMHLVQGDRRFSEWKGSVVDSVVGVFLTQNVSDVLSSSAFISVAAKFPVKSESLEKPAAEMPHTPLEQKDGYSGLSSDSIVLQGKFSVEEIITTESNEGSNSNELIGSFCGDGINHAAGQYSRAYMKSFGLHENGSAAFVVPASVVEAEDGPLEDAISSQNSVVSSHNSPDYLFHTVDPVGSSSLPYYPEANYLMRNMSNGMSNSTTYAELPRIEDFRNMRDAKVGSSEYHAIDSFTVAGMNNGFPIDLNMTYQPVNTSVSYMQNGQFDFTGVPYVSHLDKSFCTDHDRVYHSNVRQREASFYQFPSPTMANKHKTQHADYSSQPYCYMNGSLVQEGSYFPGKSTEKTDFSPAMEQSCQPFLCSEEVSFSRNGTEAPFVKQRECSNLQEVYTTRTKQIGDEKWQSGCSQQENDIRLQAKTCDKYCFPNLCENQNAHLEVSQGAPPDPTVKSKDAQKAPEEVPTNESKGKKVRGQTKKNAYDWDSLRKEVLRNRGNNQRSHNAKDSVDWEAVRKADVKEIAETIRERGMNNMLAERIKEFLNRLITDHGSIDLEWLRDLEPEIAKDYLLSIRGLGLKSAECVRLLTLHHMAFPVDTNVARICVRLGWVPLQPLPESLQLHLLELYPMLEHIQKYLWPRLCKLDQLTLYELHYQMITFGKVFCTKSKPNCNACPMRAECRHFASAFASARLALPGPEEKSLVAVGTPNAAESCHQTYIESRPVGQLGWNENYHRHVVSGNHQPIVEEPSSPESEPEITGTQETSIEDFYAEDPDDIPNINLNVELFTQNLRSYMQANNIDIEDADMSRALVAITPEAASLPTPKLKNVSRLRTEHQVYELPDTHPLLEGYEPRQPDDPCPYLLSMWTPGETAQSTDAPKTFCNSGETGILCENSTCFSCNSIQEVKSEKVRGTILIPCRTAMRGSFPLNGTYFQVNELFADHETSQNPLDVPRNEIWNLPRRTVYFGTSIPTIFRGMETDKIQHCFWRGFVCVRGFDRAERAPRPLYPRLHFPASKGVRGKRRGGGAAA